MTLGAVRYEVQRTQGGNGLWKQRYQTRIGKSYYVLPLQYNEMTKKYVAYSQGNWYIGATPRLTDAYGSDNLVVNLGALNNVTDKKGPSVSWENRCAGCHQTGLTLQKQTTTYAGTPVDEAVTGYSELNIGCEACHGPGAAHAASRNPADIINPDNFKALGVAGLRQANMVCGRCHSRGVGNFTLAGMYLPTEYYADNSGKFPVPGNNIIDNSAGNPFAILNTSSAYYGAGPLNAPPGSTDPDVASWYNNWYNGFGYTYAFPTYIASKQHHQAWTDMEQGPHAPDKSDDPVCWDCHDLHQAKGDHQVVDTVVGDGVTIKTQNDDDTLCLACHAGQGPFATLTKNDVKDLGNGVAGANLAGVVSGHTLHPFDPTGTKASRCSGCHMPKTAKTANETSIGAGIKEGDIHNHTFLAIRPEVSKTTGKAPGVNNSCSPCHKPGDTRIDPTGTLDNDPWLDALQNRYEPILSVATVGTGPVVDGDPSDTAWAGATPLTVKLGEGMDTLDCVKCHSLRDSSITVTLKAVKDATRIFFLATWNDPTASFTRAESWIYDPGTLTWTKGVSGQSEDRIGFFWPIGSITGSPYNSGGCMTKCHTTDVHPGVDLEDEAYLDSGKADFWHMKPARGMGVTSASGSDLTVDPSTHQVTAGTVRMIGYMDDQFVGQYAGQPDGGRAGDTGSFETRNRSADQTRPLYVEIAPTDFMDAMVITQAETLDNTQTLAVATATNAEIAAAWAAYQALNAVVPERIQRVPTGSRGDLTQAGTWINGTWTTEISRLLDTSDGINDVTFSSGTHIFGIAVMDNGGGDVHKTSRKLRLVIP